MQVRRDVGDRRAGGRMQSRTRAVFRRSAWVVALGLSTVWPTVGMAASWTSVSPLGIPRYALGAAASGGYVYAAGGFAPSENWYSQDVERYSPATDTWSSVSPMLEIRYGLVLAAGDAGTVYALGGSAYGNGCGALASVERYSPGTDSWSHVASMSLPRYFAAGATGRDGRIYMFGGRTTCSPSDTATAEVYDPATTPGLRSPHCRRLRRI